MQRFGNERKMGDGERAEHVPTPTEMVSRERQISTVGLSFDSKLRSRRLYYFQGGAALEFGDSDGDLRSKGTLRSRRLSTFLQPVDTWSVRTYHPPWKKTGFHGLCRRLGFTGFVRIEGFGR